MATRVRSEVLTPEQLRELLVAVIAGVKAEPVAKWRAIVGPVEQLPTWRHPACNWRVSPKGTKHQLAIVEQCVEIVKGEHPYVG